MKKTRRLMLLLLVVVSLTISSVGTALARPHGPTCQRPPRYVEPLRHHHVVRALPARVYHRPYCRPLPPPRRHRHKPPRYLYPALVGAGVGLAIWGLSR